jgi:ABC-type arginine transport system ATPase subunit
MIGCAGCCRRQQIAHHDKRTKSGDLTILARLRDWVGTMSEKNLQNLRRRRDTLLPLYNIIAYVAIFVKNCYLNAQVAAAAANMAKSE